MTAAVFFATRQGQAEHVARRIASDLRAHGVAVDVFNVRETAGIAWDRYAHAFVVASVHAGGHEKEMVAFAKRWKDELSRRDASFCSVSLSQAGARLSSNTSTRRDQACADVAGMIERFEAETGWIPRRILPVAGALTYSKYNFLLKWVMHRIARKAGFDGPPTRDYEFTDWKAVDRFVVETAGP